MSYIEILRDFDFPRFWLQYHVCTPPRAQNELIAIVLLRYHCWTTENFNFVSFFHNLKKSQELIFRSFFNPPNHDFVRTLPPSGIPPKHTFFEVQHCVIFSIFASILPPSVAPLDPPPGPPFVLAPDYDSYKAKSFFSFPLFSKNLKNITFLKYLRLSGTREIKLFAHYFLSCPQ